MTMRAPVTMNSVCQMPKPMRGATPLNQPARPFSRSHLAVPAVATHTPPTLSTG